MQIRVPRGLNSAIDIVDRATSMSHIESHTRGALVSIDLNCPADLFYGRKQLIAKFSLTFTTKIVDGFHKSVAIQDAKVGYFEDDHNIGKMVDSPQRPVPQIVGQPETTFRQGTIEIEMQQPEDSSNIRIVVLLEAYPSNMEVTASLSTADGISRPSHAFMSASNLDVAPSPDEQRLQRLLCWTAALGHDTLFEAYLDQGPSILNIEDEFGMTPFSWAALTGQASVVQLALQQAGSDSARKRTKKGFSPLEAAARSRDPNIFETFLRSLKCIKGADSVIPELLPLLELEEIEEELTEAVSGEQTATIRKLVDKLLSIQPDEASKQNWLALRMVKAAESGVLCLVQVLKACGAKVDGTPHGAANTQTFRRNRRRNTPLMSAILNNRTKVAKFLILHGAGSQDDLLAAVEENQHSTIRALLQAGIPVTEEFRNRLIEIANNNKDSTTLMLLKLEKGTGKLATHEHLHPEVDVLFEATVVDFYEDKDPRFQELTVDALMREDVDFFTPSGETIFKWFHLPANNVLGQKALIGKIYQKTPSSAYKVLDPKRWAKRQHEGERGSAHARFMIPACHDFSEAFKHKKKFGNDNKHKHVLLFMPYLHWDEERAMRHRTSLITQNSPFKQWPEIPPDQQKFKREELLLRRYLFDERRADPNSSHVLHIRRTLDQSLYHNLKDTKIRDSDQTVRRYQEELKRNSPAQEKTPFAAIMVDQLWLWILVGSSGKAEAVVTCFPSRDWHDVGMETTGSSQNERILDRRRTTDILQITKSYIQQRPSAVQTPYDLAGVIASRCSRALLDHSSDMLNFAEVYENSISSIMDEEAVLFNTFNSLMQTRTKDDLVRLEALRKHMREKQEKNNNDGGGTSHNEPLHRLAEHISDERQRSILHDTEQHCKEYRMYTLDRDIPDEYDMKLLRRSTGEAKIERLVALLEKFRRFYVLDITREITLLRQIKDIQDELEMMEKIFAEQQEALESMGRIIRTMTQHHLGSNGETQARSSDRTFSHHKVSSGSGTERHRTEGRQDLLSDLMHDDSDSDVDDILGDDYLPGTNVRESSGTGAQSRKSSSINEVPSMIWGDLRERQSLPLRTIARHSKQIKKMNERARNTNTARSRLTRNLIQLSTLVDLKQKQNNMIDTRTARLQAEQSHLMTLQAEKSGRTLMVFTIVTIVFLPLSFIAAFFAIPAKEFDKNNLTLGYVSKITCELH
ncbi:hypothetical protein BBK36DRAFT_1118298 [Trichoderma citrinoviride]|uniref:Uncharacterized protein n=1 Tax=Trichoderma citrinoviride TaxID=58853 RepID=A0A2T4BCB5_9HYPO|nr:hypothetical protein BBK36DRAFT_1118298 [Trichoderma citrinoviride]PTB66967.1 hypothetical protein BBK36DRAFT_1118298 [Trichoderma citrinoviride]